MPLTEERTRRLLSIMAQEHSKPGTTRREPAKFRSTQLDTHKSCPAEDWGPSQDLLPANFKPPPDYLSMLKTQRTAKMTKASQSLPRLGSSRGVVPPDQIQYASVFVPTPEQEHTCSLARTRRDKVANSEWALLDTLEVELYNNEKAWREKMKHQTCAEQRACLDQQVHDRKSLEEAQRLEKLRDEQLVRAQIEKEEADKAMRDHETAKKNAQLRKDRLGDMAAAQAARQAEVDNKRRDEAQMLADIQQRLALEKAAAAKRFEELKVQNVQTKLDNERRIQAKKDAIWAQKQADDELIKEGIRLAEETDRKRQEDHAKFKAMIEARVKGAGQKALEDNRAMIEREERLMREYAEKAELAAQAKERAQKEKKEAHKRMLQQGRAEYVAAKERADAEARMEMLAIKEMIDCKAREEHEAQDRKMAALRARDKDNQAFLMTQTADREARMSDEFAGMTTGERMMNRRLLKQAQKMVGAPKQLTAAFL